MNKFFDKQFLRHFISIIYFLIKYYYKKIINWLSSSFTTNSYISADKSFSLEMKSLICAFICAFFFYYFIVIELSILVFGYSLLCYRFLFLFIFISLIISWRLEVFFLKSLLTDEEKRFTVPESWLFYYDGQTPYTLYDYITNYKTKLVFKHVIVDSNIEEIEKGWYLVNTYLALFGIAFIYFCSYRFWPQYIKFVSNYFHPSINFFEIWAEPWLKDFYSVIIRFWNRLTFNLEYIYEDSPFISKLIWKIPKASAKWEAKADAVWFNKTSLRKTAGYGDIFFLRALHNNIALQPLIFELEQPTELADWFDQNIPLFFLRFMRGQLDQKNTSFWKKHFFKDNHMWDYLSTIKENVDIKFDEMDEWAPLMYYDENVITPSSYDVILSENYFDNKLKISKKDIFEYGGYWEFYDNLVSPENNEFDVNFNVLEQGFTWGIEYKDTQTYFGLRNFHKNTQDITQKFQQNQQKWVKFLTMLKIYHNNKFNSKNLLNLVSSSTPDIQLYKFWDFASYLDLDELDLDELDLISKKNLDKYLKNLDWRLTVLEEKCGITPSSFSYKDYKWINWKHLSTIILRWIWWLDAYYNNWGYYRLIKNYFPTMYEMGAYFNFSYSPSRRMWKIYQRLKKNYKEPEIYKRPSKKSIFQLAQLEKVIRQFEENVGLRKINIYDYSNSTSVNFLEKKFQPWYIRSLKYFDSWDVWFSFPGFNRFYYPTPYPTAFSTFGLNWFRYQIFNLKKNIKNNHVTESISYVGDWSTTPTVLYTGVEAIMYIKPILKIFDLIANFIIWVVSYPFEFVATKWPLFFNYLSVLIFLVHLTWFLHFYIYLFLFLYVFYYFAKFYYYQSSYMWIYEKMFETGFSTQANSLIYWHNLNDIWLNYWNPQQFAILSLQTSLFLYYSYNNLLKYTIINKNGYENFLHFLSIFYKDVQNIIDYFKYNNDKLLCYNNLSTIENFKYYKYFHKLNYKNYNFLLYEGGSDCSLEVLVWGYYDYLTQTSNFISKTLTKNFYLLENNCFNSLIKQLTILFSSQTFSVNYSFLSFPLLDNSLARKLFIEFFKSLELKCLTNKNFFFNNFTFEKSRQNIIFLYASLLNLRFNYYNYLTTNIDDLYTIFNSKNSIFLSKFLSCNEWDSKEYWFFAFFWSFWFVWKTQYPYFNLSTVHEVNWLALWWMAYSNSWIGSTINVWPFYNLVQHIWWTSWIYKKAFSITDNYLSFNSVGINWSDVVWNFLEKRYENSFSKHKIETMFGIVTTLEFIFGKTKYDKLKDFTNSSLNYDLTYPNDSYENVTTNWLYDKTNPPLNLLELDITPYRIFKFFKNFYPNNLFLYLTFLEQIDFINNKISFPTKRDIKKDYSEVEFVNTYINIKNPNSVSKFDFYLKKFDKNLKLNKDNEFNNWIFSFDTSFFFAHFLTWDYFNTSQKIFTEHNTKSNLFNKIKNKSFAEINSIYTSAGHWFDKPFGALDKLELNLMQWFKDVKDMDHLSFTPNKENPFLFLEKETFKQTSGLATLGLQDDWTSAESYDERYVGERSNRYIYNNSYINNTPGPLVLGWVGELYTATIDSTTMLFSLLYANTELDPLSFKKKWNLFHFYDFYNYKKYFFNTYFESPEEWQILYSKSFSWLNLILYPTAYRNFFGVKSLAKLDYWSWKCGLQIDYKNGYYNYRPYLGLWHTFGSWLTVFDSLYGFYRSYWQIEDDPTIIDLETDAIEWLFEDQEDSAYVEWDPETGFKNSYNLNDEDDRKILKSLSTWYWEVYFSFHHPFFLGYFLFWFFFLSKNENYLGVINFSSKWLISRNFYKNFEFTDKSFNSDYDFSFSSWEEIENWYRQQMFWYWKFFLNSIKLTNNFSNLIEFENNTLYSDIEYVITTFDDLVTNLNFIKNFNNLPTIDLTLLLDFKKLNLQLFNINFYNLDLPFPLNPFLVINPILRNQQIINYWSIYDTYFITYSHYDSLWENINFSLFYDSYIGSYLDSFNFISYYGTYRSLTLLPNNILDRPDYLATRQLWFSFDWSKIAAEKIFYNEEFYDNQDMLASTGLMFQNLSFIRFFSTTLVYLLDYSLSLKEYNVFKRFLEFYFRGFSFYYEFIQLKRKNISSEEKVFSPIIYPLSSKISMYKQSFFLSWIMRYLPYDLLLVWLDLGSLSISWKYLKKFFFFKKVSLTQRLDNLNRFYNWFGSVLFKFFFKK